MLTNLASDLIKLLKDPTAFHHEKEKREELEKRLKDLVGLLAESQRKLLTLRFGLDGGKRHSREETAEIMGIKRVNVRQREYVILKRMEYTANASLAFKKDTLVERYVSSIQKAVDMFVEEFEPPTVKFCNHCKSYYKNQMDSRTKRKLAAYKYLKGFLESSKNKEEYRVALRGSIQKIRKEVATITGIRP